MDILSGNIKKNFSERISYIIPAYNCAKTLAESVDSIFNGNFSDGDEVILVNDGSTDETLPIIESLAQKYDGIKYTSHATNMGGASARNTAVSMAKSEWIFCLDSDNKLTQSSVPKLLNFAVKNSYDIAAFENVFYFYRGSTVTHKWAYPLGDISLADALSGPISPCASGNYLYTKESWERAGGYEVASGALDAWTFGIKQLAINLRMGVMPKMGYLHRYGHRSYWVRQGLPEAVTMSASQTLLEFSHLLTDESRSLLKNSRDWFSRFDSTPITLSNSASSKSGSVLFNLLTLEGFKMALVYAVRNPRRINSQMIFWNAPEL